jgi:O-methyltransferase involved in polyketide biosynthesis
MKNEGQPSQTAMTAAAARAAHLLVDSEPRIFADTLAAPLLGDKAAGQPGHMTGPAAGTVPAWNPTWMTWLAPS